MGKKRITFILLLLISIFFLKIDLLGDWSKQYIFNENETLNQYPNNISFCDSLHGMIANNIYQIDYQFTIGLFLPECIITSDGGKHWNSVWVDSISYYIDIKSKKPIMTFKPSNFLKICYLDTSLAIGFIAGDDIWPPFQPAVLRTTDNGYHWQHVLLDSDDIGVSIKMLNEKSGMCATKKFVYLTEDSGKTWNKIIIPYFDSLNKYIIMDAEYPDENDIILMVVQHPDVINNIFRSNDKGKNWQINSLCDSSLINGFSFFFLDKFNGWRSTQSVNMINDSFYYNDRIYYTSDEGETWDKIFEQLTILKAGPSTTLPWHIKFYDKKNGIAYNQNQQLYITKDGGKTWCQQLKYNYNSVDTCYQFSNVTFAGSIDNIWVLCYWPTGDAIFHYLANNDWVYESLLNQYGNSFEVIKPKGNISIQNNMDLEIVSNRDGILEIDAYSLTGGLVTNLYNQEVQEGDNKLKMNLSCLKNNLYLIVIKFNYESKGFLLYKMQ